MARRGEFDAAVRPFIYTAVLIIFLGFVYKYWYVMVPLLVALVVAFFYFLRRGRRRAGLTDWPWIKRP